MARLPRKILWYLAVTFGLSWLLISGFRATGGQWNTPASLIITSLYMCVPLLSAVIVQTGIYRSPLKLQIAFSFKMSPWYVVAWLLPFALFSLTLLFSLKVPGVSFSRTMEGLFDRYAKIMTPEQLEQLRQQMAVLPFHPFFAALGQAFIAGFTINALVAFGEEAGWRGFLWNELSRLGFLNASLFIGMIWGIWHAPLILMGHNYPDHPQAGVFMMIVLCMLFSPILCYLRVKTGSSIAAAIAHGSFNATAGLPLMLLKGGSDLTAGTTGAAGLAALLVINLAIFCFEKFKSPRPATPASQTQP